MQDNNLPDPGSKNATDDAKEANTSLSINIDPVNPNLDFPIIGIGASAGGLAAFESFFSNMPKHIAPGMAFVLVQHLAPDHKSILTSLIQSYTQMEVSEVTNGVLVKPNSAYIIPPGYDMSLENGRLQLLEPSAPRGQRLPIDFFFTSLALEQREKSICIILSGNGTDGTIGLQAIKSAGGLVIAQKPESADYDSMPKNAINTGLVDYELLPSEMPAQIISYLTKISSDLINPNRLLQLEKNQVLYTRLFSLLHSQTNHDFSQYKTGTIHRRIDRRMGILQVDTLESYLNYIEENPKELDLLFRDLLISVTNFFRDPDVFLFLETTIIPKLFENRQPGSIIRVWVAGCATGEEAYSIAILMQEQIEKLKQNFKLQVFATDIDSNAISFARAGLYPAAITSNISQERLMRFFIPESNRTQYRIQKSIRDILVFSEQDLIKDPPFSKLDLISCRNLMIYLGAELQKKIISLFHYALNEDGLLLLGTSETVGDSTNLFNIVDRKLKFYQKKEIFKQNQQGAVSRYFPRTTRLFDATLQQTLEKQIVPKKIPLRELTEQNLLLYVTPASVLINSLGDILYIHGRTGMFLEPSLGEAGVINILKMAREGLKTDLTLALREAVLKKEKVSRQAIRVKTNGHFTKVNLTVRPIMNEKIVGSEMLYLVTMEEALDLEQKQDDLQNLIQEKKESKNLDIVTANAIILALRQELREKEEYLQNANEELETSNEELKSSNEEMQSINEELQSTNEELETSKEELQSVNEELTTVNTELQTKVMDLSRLNNDINNLFSGTGIATIFVDFSMRILRFTPETMRIINLIQADIGRPVGHILSNLINYDKLFVDIQSVLDSLIPKEIEVQTKDNKWYALRIHPYRTLDNIIEGAVITFIDINEIKLANEKIQSLVLEKEVILKEVHHRIKNNMNTIYSILSLQAETLKDPTARSALEETGNRVKSMMLLYDKLYKSVNFKTISVKDYIPFLVDEIIANFPTTIPLVIEKNIEDFSLDAKRLQPLGIIINELLTNIMKYAFTGRSNGLIKIATTLEGNIVTLTIEDNGNGIPESIDFNNSTGFGIMLVNILTMQLPGTVRIVREHGTKIIIEFQK